MTKSFIHLPVFTVAQNDIIVRRATLAGAPSIAALVNLGEREGQLLPRSLDAIRASIDDWIVATDQQRVVGVGSLVEMHSALAEVRSLAVAPDYRQFGIGGRIVNALVDLARERNIATVFTLTRAVLFFEKLGFIITDKENFPEKVWRDCSLCPVQLACDEVAMVKSVRSEQ
ncbi:MAG: GNAT family N-acetyltransferase [Chloroflexi bacterium]|nr:GNAT family N-acetyltransferase [Chloroflexota bacterium]